MEEIINRLKDLRISAGVSISELARRTNTERARLSEIEHGHGGLTLKRMLAMADVLGYETQVSFIKK